jgi:hypothetical protein
MAVPVPCPPELYTDPRFGAMAESGSNVRSSCRLRISGASDSLLLTNLKMADGFDGTVDFLAPGSQDAFMLLLSVPQPRAERLSLSVSKSRPLPPTISHLGFRIRL